MYKSLVHREPDVTCSDEMVVILPPHTVRTTVSEVKKSPKLLEKTTEGHLGGREVEGGLVFHNNQ